MALTHGVPIKVEPIGLRDRMPIHPPNGNLRVSAPYRTPLKVFSEVLISFKLVWMSFGVEDISSTPRWMASCFSRTASARTLGPEECGHVGRASNGA
ncbi:hypothetical protein AGOR_G00018340 [Albula goreensis]|uniref:Uncharacterized protein n=1 Tax=Albula goreensis TaxID=1534307 RepID=A0A8T3E4V4_9TELE|nr:hypothetical protein AGOR_G00018340 [Albula goreensis]